MPAKRKGNREKLVPVILDRIARGETLRAICREDGMPSRDQFDQWRREDDVIAHRVARARDIGFDALADECLAIADDALQDTIETKKGLICNKEWVLRSKLRVETRLKLAAVFCPSKYGQKAHLEHSGKDGGPIQTVTEFVLASLRTEGE